MKFSSALLLVALLGYSTTSDNVNAINLSQTMTKTEALKFDVGDAISKAKDMAGNVGGAIDKLSDDDKKKLLEKYKVPGLDEAKSAVKHIIKGHLSTIKEIGESPEGKIVAALAGDSIEAKVKLILKIIEAIINNPLMDGR